MKRHAAGPDLQSLQRVVKKVGWTVKQYETEAAAEDNADGRPEQKIVDMHRGDIGRRPARHPARITPAQYQSEQIGERVPPDDDRADFQGDRI